MNAISAVILEAHKNGRYYTFAIPMSATYQEAEEVALEMIQNIKVMAANDPRNKPEEVKAEFVEESQSAM
jgi:hypothetical protein